MLTWLCMQGHHLLPRQTLRGQGLTWIAKGLRSQRRSFLSGVPGEKVVPRFAHGPSLVFQSRPGSNAPCPLLLHGQDQPAAWMGVRKRGAGRSASPHLLRVFQSHVGPARGVLPHFPGWDLGSSEPQPTCLGTHLWPGGLAPAPAVQVCLAIGTLSP